MDAISLQARSGSQAIYGNFAVLRAWQEANGTYGTRDEVGANAASTLVSTADYSLEAASLKVGLFDRVEVSIARQTFNTRDIGAALGLGTDFRLKQNIYGVKVKVFGDAVLEQDSWLPQIAVGAQYKKNEQGDVVRSVGATNDNGTDVYVSATKIILDQSILWNATLRATKANQLGILGFGGEKNDSYSPMLEGSLAYLACSTIAFGGEYRMKPDNLKIAKEENWSDLFLAWAPTKNISLTAAYVMLGNIVLREKQQGGYASLQLGF